MELNFYKREGVDLSCVKYGDILILEDDSKWLVVKDTDGYDYRGINLETNEVTDYQNSPKKLVEGELCGGAVIKIIKSEDLVLGVR